VEKRRADFLLGRATAKAVVIAALAEVRPAPWRAGSLELPADPGGAPFARLALEAAPIAGFAPGERLPVSVSISHHEGRALCAAAWIGPGAPWRAVGIDLGRIEPRSAGLQRTFFTDGEQRWIGAAPSGEADLRANLVWCAKEAALKALGLGLTVDTRWLDCLPEDTPADPTHWPLRPPGGGWRRFGVRCAPALLPEGALLRGAWRAFDGFVGALASLSARAGPGPTPP
jgi:phosphopantetheinyl transferase (holo-ACP synthase)